MAGGRLPFRFGHHELGLLVPIARQPESPVLPNASVYLSHRDLPGAEPLHESDLVGSLRKLSAADCLWAIAHLNTRLFAETRPDARAQLQRRLMVEVIGDGELGSALEQALEEGIATTVFCEQQLVHLARLVILHADRRPHDDFDSGRLRDEWAKCLIGVNDLLDVNIDIEDHDERLTREIRQCALNHHEDQLPVTGIHHEVYRVLWPEMKNARSAEVEDAFRRHTKMTIGDYFTVGAATLVHLMMRGPDGNGAPLIKPTEYFASAQMEPSTWRAFFALAARDLDTLRTQLVDEAEEYGEMTYGSLTFERFPLIEIETGTFLPLSMHSLQRRISQGVFHLLKQAAEADGYDHRHYSSNFGKVFQRSVEQTLRRGVAFGSDDVPIAADVRYGSRKQPVDSSDVILGYDRHPVFIEVVSGPLQAGTFTQGHLCCFEADTTRLVVEKAKQLDLPHRTWRWQGTRKRALRAPVRRGQCRVRATDARHRCSRRECAHGTCVERSCIPGERCFRCATRPGPRARRRRTSVTLPLLPATSR